MKIHSIEIQFNGEQYEGNVAYHDPDLDRHAVITLTEPECRTILDQMKWELPAARVEIINGTPLLNKEDFKENEDAQGSSV